MRYSSMAFPFPPRPGAPDSGTRSKNSSPILSKSPIAPMSQRSPARILGWAFACGDGATRKDWKRSIPYGRHKKRSWLLVVRNPSYWDVNYIIVFASPHWPLHKGYVLYSNSPRRLPRSIFTGLATKVFNFFGRTIILWIRSFLFLPSTLLWKSLPWHIFF